MLISEKEVPMKKISKLKLVKYLMALAGAGFLLALWLVPSMEGMRGDIWVYFLFGIYMLLTVFVWALDHKSSDHFQTSHKDDVGKMDKSELEGLRDQIRWRFTKF